ncbi:MAG: glycine cleavage system protein GcvH [Deltaproteobacteria bacterium]|nr:MAG: glycine cleavage system protein GcvH [Deltaproteobacteria bacterium]
MKEINELNLPDDLRYAEDHEWARSEKNNIRVGIDDYAQDQLGDIVYVDLPQKGDKFSKGEEFGTVESVKAVSELFIPVGGEVIEINKNLEDIPELVNNSPYDEGWMILIKPDDPAELNALMDRDAYLEMLKGQ